MPVQGLVLGYEVRTAVDAPALCQVISCGLVVAELADFGPTIGGVAEALFAPHGVFARGRRHQRCAVGAPHYTAAQISSKVIVVEPIRITVPVDSGVVSSMGAPST